MIPEAGLNRKLTGKKPAEPGSSGSGMGTGGVFFADRLFGGVSGAKELPP